MKQTTSPEAALQKVREEFPFEGYMDRAVNAYRTIIAVVTRYLEPGSRILDFGSGPCDKTAVVQALGFRCTAYDDFGDEWHADGDNRQKIFEFADRSGIELKKQSDGYLPFAAESFDMVMIHDVLEHLHDSPRELMLELLNLLVPEGYVFVTVPNAANLRKRVALTVGRTNLPRFDTYYWSSKPWRGHVREYVKDDLRKMADYLGLDVVELRGCHHMLRRLPRWAHLPYRALTFLVPGACDTWLLLARKPRQWSPRRTLEREEHERLLGQITPCYRESGA